MAVFSGFCYVLEVNITPSKIFLAFCAGIILGVFYADTFSPGLKPALVLASIGFLCVVIIFPRRTFLTLVGVVFLGASLAFLRVGSFIEGAASSDLSRFSGSKVELLGNVSEYPDKRAKNERLVLNVRQVNGNKASGRVLVFADRAGNFSYGDILLVSGKLEKPEPFNGFDYPRYLLKDGITAVLTANSAAKEGLGGSVLNKIVYLSRQNLDYVSTSIMPFHYGAILKAVLLGDENSMTDGFKQDLNRAGLRHIVAVSGMNITIIFGIVAYFAFLIGLSRFVSFALAAFFILFFVAMIGFPASAVRAALMGGLLYLAPLLGRRPSGFRISIFAAAVMVFLSPLILTQDVGFQLSFLGVLGIIFLSPIIEKKLTFLPRFLRMVLATTLGAQLAVFPILLSAFGQASIISPLTNLFVVPFLPIVTILGFAASLAGILWLKLGIIFAAPLLPYFAFLSVVTRGAARLPVLSSFLPSGIFAGFAVLWYLGLSAAIFLNHKRRVRPADLTNLSPEN